MPDRLDLIIIGAGPGGYVAAIRAAQLGMSVACLDRRGRPGGTCLNIGCIPSKALLDSSELYAVTRTRLAGHGIELAGVGLDLRRTMERKDAVVRGLTDGVSHLLKKNKVTFLKGSARLAAGPRVMVQGETGSTILEARAVLLATGSEAASLPALAFDGTSIVSSTEALAFDKVPSHLIVVGGGYIGLELGSVWSRLGSAVSVLEFLPRIVPAADAEMAGLLQQALAKQGLKFLLDTKVLSASVQAAKVVVNAQSKGQDVTVEGDRVLVAVGRQPCVAGLGLEEAGVALDARTGRVRVDASFRTTAEGVYAIGDLIAGPMLAHKAEEEGMAVAEILVGRPAHVNYDTIPSVVYTWPEMASVGATEEQLKERAIDYRVGKFPFSANGRARCLGDTEGQVKILADRRSDRILGVHILGPRASDLIGEAVVAMEFAGSAEDLARTCHAHPSLSEAIREAALAVDGRAIHI